MIPPKTDGSLPVWLASLRALRSDSGELPLIRNGRVPRTGRVLC